MYKIGEVHFRFFGTNAFKRFTAEGRENFTSSVSRLRRKRAPKRAPHVQHEYFFLSYFFGGKKGAPHAARLFFFIQRIKSLICGVVVAVGHYPGAGNSLIPVVCPGGGGGMLKFRFDRSISDASFETSRPHPQPSSTYFQENCAEDFFFPVILSLSLLLLLP